MKPDATVKWRPLEDGDPALRSSQCLYALVNRSHTKLLYIGKAYWSHVQARLDCRSKDAVFERLRRYAAFGVLYGEVQLPRGYRRSEGIISDIESLLINREDPEGNWSCTRSRGITRPGLTVACTGSWPGNRKFYEDDD